MYIQSTFNQVLSFLIEGDRRYSFQTPHLSARPPRWYIISPPFTDGYPGLAPHGGNLIIGCADNAAARRAMAECLQADPHQWLIDAGNDTNWGQILVGNVADPESWEGPVFDGETCHLAPAPTLQRPDLLTAVPTTPPDVDCAAALDLTDQDPTINQMMASLVLQVVRRMVAGACPWLGLYLDMDLGTVKPTYVTPETVKRVMELSSNEVEGA